MPSNAGDVGWIPGWGTKISHATGQLENLWDLEPMLCHNRSWCTQTGDPYTIANAHAPQLENLPDTENIESPRTTTKTQHSQKTNKNKNLGSQAHGAHWLVKTLMCWKVICPDSSRTGCGTSVPPPRTHPVRVFFFFFGNKTTISIALWWILLETSHT